MARLADCLSLRRFAGRSSSPPIRLVRRFGADRRGNIAIIFVFMLGVLMLFVGGAVDFTRYNTVRADLIESMDAAGLAMAQIDALNGPEIKDLSGEEREVYLKEQGKKFFQENFKHANLVDDLIVDFERTTSRSTPKASGSIKTLFLGIGGMLQFGSATNNLASLDLATDTAIVRRDDGNIELAMVMDVTGSMGGTKIADLRSAAKEMVDIVVREDQTEWYSKVALVPYSIGVNVGSYATSVRGATAPAKPITGAGWKDGTDKNITGVSTTNPVVVTANSHGFSNGDTVWIVGVDSSGGSGNSRIKKKINDKAYTVANKTRNPFQLQGVDGTSWSGSYSGSSNDFATKCLRSNC
ncbi:MAG: pilus assembly protein, partial [Amphiplicatus sp.]